MSRDQPPPHRPAQTPAIDIRALLTRREYIKTTAYLLPRRAKIQVLEMMEELRHARRDRKITAARGHPAPLPEMSGGELVREINWRTGTLPPRDAEAVAQCIRRLTRWRAARRGRVGEPRPQPANPLPQRAVR